MATTEAPRAAPVGPLAWGRKLRTSRLATLAADPAQVRLGHALAARVTEVTRLTLVSAVAGGLIELTSPRFVKQIRDVHTLTSRVIARFLITGQGTTEIERNFISRVGAFAARYGLSLAILSRSYVVWRDTNLRILNEEAGRLGIGQSVSSVARDIIKSSAESGLRRMTRAYDYQLQLVARHESSMEGCPGRDGVSRANRESQGRSRGSSPPAFEDPQPAGPRGR